MFIPIYKTEYQTRRALIIGIDKYTIASPLGYAVSDAKAIAEILETRFNFQKTDITILLDSKATKSNILKAFHSYTQDNTQLDDKLLIFFAGHGHTITGYRGEVGFLIPTDGDPNDTSTLIRWDELTKNSELINAKHILFIMDACYSGLAITRTPAGGSRRFLKDMCQRMARQVITAGKADEVVADHGGPKPNHSVFTGHLLEALEGKAATNKGAITANGVMAYVYEKVGNDPNSHQTPHYGFVEGDGDFIFTDDLLNEISSEANKDQDILIEIPIMQKTESEQLTLTDQIKQYVADPAKRIILHDLVISEVKHQISRTSKDKLPLGSGGRLTNEEIVGRIKYYEKENESLNTIFSLISYWGQTEQISLLQKALQVLTDANGVTGGTKIWLNMRWYPACLLLYLSGISSLSSNKYDTLARLLTTQVNCDLNGEAKQIVVSAFIEVQEIYESFKSLPGHEQNYVPISEYVFKLLQPKLDELLFLGNGYEYLFDRFEMLVYLICCDLVGFGPLGRFGYKHSSRLKHGKSIFEELLDEAESQKQQWAPIKAGLFKGSYERFKSISVPSLERLNKLGWW